MADHVLGLGAPVAVAPEDDYEPMARCGVCGCDEFHACEGGCWWVPDPAGEIDLCSVCLPARELDLALAETYARRTAVWA